MTLVARKEVWRKDNLYVTKEIIDYPYNNSALIKATIYICDGVAISEVSNSSTRINKLLEDVESVRLPFKGKIENWIRSRLKSKIQRQKIKVKYLIHEQKKLEDLEKALETMYK